MLPFKRPMFCPAVKTVLAILALTVTLNYIPFTGLAQQEEQRPRRVESQPQKPPAKPGQKEQPPQEEADAIKIKSSLVTVPVSVSNAAGEPVTNLAAKDFRLEEEGEQQTVTLLAQPGKNPVDLALLFDISGSVLDKFQFEQQAAARFLKKVMNPGDHVTVFSIALKPRLATPRTAQVTETITGIESLVPSKEATAFFDGRGCRKIPWREGDPGSAPCIDCDFGWRRQSERLLHP